MAAFWKDMDQRLKNVERAIKLPSSLEEEIRADKSKRLTPPTIQELSERSKDLMDPRMFNKKSTW